MARAEHDYLTRALSHCGNHMGNTALELGMRSEAGEMPEHWGFSRPTRRSFTIHPVTQTESIVMRSILWALAVMLALAGSHAMAVDPTDEDVSYLPQSQLEGMTGNRYGHDKVAYRKCMDASRKKATGTAEEVATACRLNATPKRCRGLSAQPGENGSKSAQEICASKCRSAGARAAQKDACSLN